MFWKKRSIEIHADDSESKRHKVEERKVAEPAAPKQKPKPIEGPYFKLWHRGLVGHYSSTGSPSDEEVFQFLVHKLRTSIGFRIDKFENNSITFMDSESKYSVTNSSYGVFSVEIESPDIERFSLVAKLTEFDGMTLKKDLNLCEFDLFLLCLLESNRTYTEISIDEPTTDRFVTRTRINVNLTNHQLKSLFDVQYESWEDFLNTAAKAYVYDSLIADGVNGKSLRGEVGMLAEQCGMDINTADAFAKKFIRQFF